MTPETVDRGRNIAKQALAFALLDGGANQETQLGDLRRAILLLFGPEVDAALAAEFDRSKDRPATRKGNA